MEELFRNYETVLTALAFGVFAYFTQGTSAIYATIPLVVLSYFNANQARQLKRMETQLQELRAMLGTRQS